MAEPSILAPGDCCGCGLPIHLGEPYLWLPRPELRAHTECLESVERSEIERCRGCGQEGERDGDPDLDLACEGLAEGLCFNCRETMTLGPPLPRAPKLYGGAPVPGTGSNAHVLREVCFHDLAALRSEARCG